MRLLARNNDTAGDTPIRPRAVENECLERGIGGKERHQQFRARHKKEVPTKNRATYALLPRKTMHRRVYRGCTHTVRGLTGLKPHAGWPLTHDSQYGPQTTSPASSFAKTASASDSTVARRSSSIRSHVRYMFPIRALFENRAR